MLASGATAVLAYNDLVAMGLLSAVGRGMPRPADLSIVGFDDIPFAAYTSPPLTTAAVPAAELGSRAWSAMRAMIGGEDPEPSACARSCCAAARTLARVVLAGQLASPPGRRVTACRAVRATR